MLLISKVFYWCPLWYGYDTPYYVHDVYMIFRDIVMCLRMTKLSSVIADLITIIYLLLKNSA